MAKASEEKTVRILIVDDDEVDRTAVRKALGKGEIRTDVREAKTAREGLQAAAGNHTDVILLDYKLPDMDGLQALRQLRQRGVAAPIVLLTGHGSEDVAVQAMKLGASDYLVKDSLRGPRLIQTVRNVLAKHRLEGEVSRLSDAVALRERIALVGVLSATAVEAIRDGVTSIRDWHEEQKATTGRGRRPASKQDEELAETLESLEDIAEVLETLRRLLSTGPTPRPTRLDDVVKKTLAVHGRVIPKRIRLETKIDATPAAPLDAEAVRQVLHRLLSNAVEAIPEEGRVKITTGADKQRVFLTVEDTGTGVPTAFEPRLFELFATTKEGHEGIGLTLAKHLVEVQGGTLVHERPAKGARFTVAFPLRA